MASASDVGASCSAPSLVSPYSRNICLMSYLTVCRKTWLSVSRTAGLVVVAFSHGELRIAIVTWIERTYHRRRRRDALGR